MYMKIDLSQNIFTDIGYKIKASHTSPQHNCLSRRAGSCGILKEIIEIRIPIMCYVVFLKPEAKGEWICSETQLATFVNNMLNLREYKTSAHVFVLCFKYAGSCRARWKQP